VVRLGVRPVGGLALIDTEMTKLAATALASLGGLRSSAPNAAERVPRPGAVKPNNCAPLFSTHWHTIQDAPGGGPDRSSGLLAVGGLSDLQTSLSRRSTNKRKSSITSPRAC